MAVLPCVNPYPRVRPALAVLAAGALGGLLLVASSRAGATAQPVAGSQTSATAAYALAADTR